MDKDIDALMWDLVYGYITSHPREAAERIANFVKAPERLYLLEHKKDKGEKRMESVQLNKQVEKLEHELHQMNIYLKSIAESLANRKVILRTKPENAKKIRDLLPHGLEANTIFIDEAAGIFNGYDITREELSEDDLK